VPLRAFIDGREVIAPLVSDAEWERLRKVAAEGALTVVLPCCDSPGHLRTSKRGNKHFVHQRRTGCDWKPETWQHLKAKSEIVLACQEAGYQASTEVAGKDWRADVMASKGAVRIAFEVQWSPQTLEETEMRQERYRRDGIRGCWFFRAPPVLMARQDLPLFRLSVQENAAQVDLDDNQSFALRDLVRTLLGGKVKFCPRMTFRYRARVDFYRVKCEKCQQEFHVYALAGEHLASGCGVIQERKPTDFWGLSALSTPEMQKGLAGFIRTREGKNLRPGTIKLRTANMDWLKKMSFGCPNCDAYFAAERYAPSQAECSFELDLGSIALDNPHWCYSPGKQFCCT
jgi:competence protein CoiA-like protein